MKNRIMRLAFFTGLTVVFYVQPVFGQARQNVPDAERTDSAAAQAEQMRPSDGVIIQESAGADHSEKSWGWLGLFGLAGLFGLRRHHDVHVRDASLSGAKT